MDHQQQTNTDNTAARIAQLNDTFRSTLVFGGKTFLSAGVAQLDQDNIGEIVAAIRAFDGFTEDNDPYGEHDFGSVEVRGERILWKIDYYDNNYQYGSEDPADGRITKRVLTIMYASEY